MGMGYLRLVSGARTELGVQDEEGVILNGSCVGIMMRNRFRAHHGDGIPTSRRCRQV